MGPYPVQKFSVGDLVKRRDKEWYAVVLDFKTELHNFLNPYGEPYTLPEGSTAYPIIMWIGSGNIDSCSSNLLEVVSEGR